MQIKNRTYDLKIQIYFVCEEILLYINILYVRNYIFRANVENYSISTNLGNF